MADKKSGIDKDLIRDLANILNETDLTEIEVDKDDLHIRVSKANNAQYMQAAPMAAPAPIAAAPAVTASAGDNEPAAPVAAGTALSSPMVGTSYLSPAPGAKPFVEVGQSIKKGETAVIIEAMKTMNQIPATCSGVVTAILVEDGQPIEFGDPLIMIE